MENILNIINSYPERFDTESKKVMFVFGQAVQKVRMSVSKTERMKLHEIETPFSVGRLDINKYYMKLYAHVYNLSETNEIDIKELLEYVSMKTIDFKEYAELQFCYALGLTINASALSEVYTFAEACKLWGLGESTLRKANLDERFQEGEIRQSGSTWLVTKHAMERLYKK
jgi:hypothetical protein